MGDGLTDKGMHTSDTNGSPLIGYSHLWEHYIGGEKLKTTAVQWALTLSLLDQDIIERLLGRLHRGDLRWCPTPKITYPSPKASLSGAWLLWFFWLYLSKVRLVLYYSSLCLGETEAIHVWAIASSTYVRLRRIISSRLSWCGACWNTSNRSSSAPLYFILSLDDMEPTTATWLYVATPLGKTLLTDPSISLAKSDK